MSRNLPMVQKHLMYITMMEYLVLVIITVIVMDIVMSIIMNMTTIPLVNLKVNLALSTLAVSIWESMVEFWFVSSLTVLNVLRNNL